MAKWDGSGSITKNCTWIIIADTPSMFNTPNTIQRVYFIFISLTASRVNLALTHLEIEDHTFGLNSSGCQLQFLEVRDGIGLTAPLVGTYCNKKIPPHIVSNGEALTVNLVTLRGTANANNFVATYSIDGTSKIEGYFFYIK
jgi:CUB domain